MSPMVSKGGKSKATLATYSTGSGSGKFVAASATMVPRLVPPAAGRVRLRTVGVKYQQVTADLTAPVQVSTPSGVAVVARPGQIGIPVYAGRDPSRLTVSLEIDRLDTAGAVDREFALIERFAGYHGAPPPLVIEGVGVPHAFDREPQHRWWISEEPDFTEQTSRDGVFCRLACTLVLTRLDGVSDDALEQATERSFHIVRAKGLRTQRQIAKHYRTTWSRLRAFNPKLPADPDKKLPVDTQVRLS